MQSLESIKQIAHAIDQAVDAAPQGDDVTANNLSEYHAGVHAGIRVAIEAHETAAYVEELLSGVQLGGKMESPPEPYFVLGLFAGSLAVHKLVQNMGHAE